jgi:hypothetical protein
MEENENAPVDEKSREISRNTQRISNEIKSLERELLEIQNSCTHTGYLLKNCSTGPDHSFSLKRVCETCHLDIGYPSQEEINKWLNS